MPEPIRQSVLDHDLSARVAQSAAVVASPALAAETIIASVTVARYGDLPIVSGVLLIGWCAFTVGTSGVSGQLRIRQTSVSGAIVADSGAVSETAANLDARTIVGFDAGAGVSVYKLTLQVASGAAPSTVSAVNLVAIPV